MSGPDLFRRPARRPLVSASILAADFARLGEECRSVLVAGADLLHLDVMDGHFVPNLTMGPDLCRCLRANLGPDVGLDVHLMVEDPAAMIGPFAEAGADLLTVHAEAGGDPVALAAAIHGAGSAAGLALNPGTPVDGLEAAIEAVDVVLVMSVQPGFAGQAFRPEVLETTRAVAALLRDDQRLEMDGGISPATAPACREAGCDLLVAASAIFGADDRAGAIARLRGD